MKNVLIRAYAIKNLGDDILIKIICERFCDVKFFMFSGLSYKKTKISEINNLYIINNRNIFIRCINFLLKKLKCKIMQNNPIILNYFNCVIEVGGSIFIENDYSDEDFSNRIVLLNNIKNYFILGCNFGPYSTIEYIEKYKNFFIKCADVCFRDRYSYNLFSEIANVRLGGDIVFSLKNDNKVDSENYVLFSVIKPPFSLGLSYCKEEYYNKIKNLAVEIILERKNRIKFISFCGAEGDETAIEEIINLIPVDYHDYISIYKYKGNIIQALDIIKKSNSIVATRFHAVVLGLLFNKTVFPVVYSQKTINLLNDINFNGYYSSFDDLNTIDYSLYKKNIYTRFSNVELSKKNSEKIFLKLNEYLK